MRCAPVGEVPEGTETMTTQRGTVVEGTNENERDGRRQKKNFSSSE